jgi:hypothetical protein
MLAVGGFAGSMTAAYGAGGRAPSYTPPADVQGTWVDDEPQVQPVAFRQNEMPQGQYYQGNSGSATQQSPQPVPAAQDQSGGGQSYGGCNDANQGGYGDCQGGEWGDSQGCFGDGGEGGWGCGDANWGAGSLWNQVHSHRRFWVRTEYLHMKVQGADLPPLVTTSPAGTAQAQAGVLVVNPNGTFDSTTTQILFGNQDANRAWTDGGRINFGMWLVDGEFLGIEGHYMRLNPSNTNFTAAGDFTNNTTADDLILARPFMNTVTGLQDSVLLAYPQAIVSGLQNPTDLTGSVTIQNATKVQSAGALLRKLLWIDFTDNYRVDFLAGYRWFRVNDALVINDSTTFNAGLIGNETILSRDAFFGNNQFHGGEIGLSTQFHRGRFSTDLITKIALGNVRETVQIDGSTTIQVGGASSTTAGGVLAQPTNIGTTRRDKFAVLPDIGLNGRLDITQNLRLVAGYNFMLLSRAARGAEQVDLNVDPRQIHATFAGATQPVRSIHDDVFYAHGLSTGLELNW